MCPASRRPAVRNRLDLMHIVIRPHVDRARVFIRKLRVSLKGIRLLLVGKPFHQNLGETPDLGRIKSGHLRLRVNSERLAAIFLVVHIMR
jgi:hypothetical protein